MQWFVTPTRSPPARRESRSPRRRSSRARSSGSVSQSQATDSVDGNRDGRREARAPSGAMYDPLALALGVPPLAEVLEAARRSRRRRRSAPRAHGIPSASPSSPSAVMQSLREEDVAPRAESLGGRVLRETMRARSRRGPSSSSFPARSRRTKLPWWTMNLRSRVGICLQASHVHDVACSMSRCRERNAKYDALDGVEQGRRSARSVERVREDRVALELR